MSLKGSVLNESETAAVKSAALLLQAESEGEAEFAEIDGLYATVELCVPTVWELS